MALLVYACAGAAYWLAMIYAMAQVTRQLPLLKDLAPPEPPDWPALTVVLAARDEEENIEPAMRSLLAQDYPGLRVVAVDDRSRDRTGEILDAVARENPRLTVVHNRELPEGWLGKPHALKLGLDQADSAWVLLTDADVEFHGPALRRAVAYAMAHRLDHLTALPQLYRSHLPLESLIFSFARQICLAGRLWRINDQRSKAFMGVGAFNLLRREAWDRTAGMEWLKLEVADDAGVGLLMRSSGGRQHLVCARGLIALQWYGSFAQAARGCEKAYAVVGRCSFLQMTALSLLILALELSIVVLMIPMGVAWAPPAALAMYLLFAAAAVVNCRWSGARIAAGLLSPLAAVPAAVLSIRAAVLGWRRGGIMWRDTLYPCRLFGEQRVKLF